MFEWNETHLAIRDAVRRFVEAEIKPNIEALEHGGTPPYEILRKFMGEFGVRDMAIAQFEAQIARSLLAG